MEELKGCPVCGLQPQVLNEVIICQDDYHTVMIIEETKAEAIKAWNTRKGEGKNIS